MEATTKGPPKNYICFCIGTHPCVHINMQCGISVEIYNSSSVEDSILLCSIKESRVVHRESQGRSNKVLWSRFLLSQIVMEKTENLGQDPVDVDRVVFKDQFVTCFPDSPSHIKWKGFMIPHILVSPRDFCLQVTQWTWKSKVEAHKDFLPLSNNEITLEK